MNYKLSSLDKSLKVFLAIYILVVTSGVSIGLYFLKHTTSLTPRGAVERFNGSKNLDNQFDVEINYPKPISEMLITTHNHILGLSFIFFTVGTIFYFNSIIKGKLKLFFMIEPLISLIVSFGSIWLMRFVNENFVYLTIISASLMYLTFYFMVIIILYEILLR